ncbi:MAG: protein kinase domain-containing protein, partial [Gemmatimonadaceae bacterium]
FLKEISLTASLQHPHILPLFDSGSADGLLYYVMPYVEGETLRGLLSRERQLAVPVAVRIAREVADALDYAHKRNVIHRDVKPENILLHDGRPMVADFGIALAVQQAGGERMTQTGMSLGTPQYMAPEQAMGDRSVDHRADIYALGAVTYEMLAGEPPFVGPTPQAIVAKVITEKPKPLREVRETVPRAVAAAVHAALQKLPADRPESAAAFAAGLEGTASQLIAEEPPGRKFYRRNVIAGALALLGVGVLTGFGISRLMPADDVPEPVPSRLTVLTPGIGGTGPSGANRQIALAADGSAVVYVAITRSGENGLVYRRLDAIEPLILPGTDGMLNPMVSPDGRQVIGGGGSLFNTRAFAGRSITVSSGQISNMPPGLRFNFAAWTPDGTIWYKSQVNGGLAAFRPGGEIVHKEAVKTPGLSIQHMLSDGRTAIMTRIPVGTSTGPALLVDVETGAETVLMDDPLVEIRYTLGFLVFVRPDGTMWAVEFDERSKRITGVPVQIASSVSITGNGAAQFAASANGTVAYIPEEPRSLVFADRQGNFRFATAEGRSFHAPQFSPDGRRISVDFTTADGRDVWILSMAQGTLSRATFDHDGHDATWSPDGQSITYTTFRNNSTFGLYRVRPGSGAKPESLTVNPQLGYTGVWLPDGSGLVSNGNDMLPGSGGSGSGRDVVIVRDGGRGPVEPLIANSFETQYPVVSPDGRWLAFVSDQSGRNEVYVRTLSGDGVEVQVSQDGGSEPVWGRDGRELFYRGGSETRIDLVAASVRATPAFEVTERRALFELTDILGANPHANYDVSPDGRTFVMVRRSPGDRIVVLQNLPQLVKRLRG